MIVRLVLFSAIFLVSPAGYSTPLEPDENEEPDDHGQIADLDDDGVPDHLDHCADSTGEVWSQRKLFEDGQPIVALYWGCSDSQRPQSGIDTDQDGVLNKWDQCNYTPKTEESQKIGDKIYLRRKKVWTEPSSEWLGCAQGELRDSSTGVVPLSELSTREREIVDATNNYLSSRGRQPLKVARFLLEQCRRHAVNMATRLGLQHGPVVGISENIAMGVGTGWAAVNMWLGSAGHFANIINASNRLIGVGFYRGYACQQFSN